MKIYLRNQSAKLPQHLALLKRMPVMAYEKTRLTEKRTEVTVAPDRKLTDLQTDFFFAYHIFPERILTHLCQWDNEGRKMQEGDTIVQQIMLPPFSPLSQKIICGVRIKQIIQESDRIGYSYETLNGHVEKGISTFTLENRPGGVSFVIHTYSSPAGILARIISPFFSVPYQSYCTRQAMHNVRNSIGQQMKV